MFFRPKEVVSFTIRWEPVLCWSSVVIPNSMGFFLDFSIVFITFISKVMFSIFKPLLNTNIYLKLFSSSFSTFSQQILISLDTKEEQLWILLWAMIFLIEIHVSRGVASKCFQSYHNPRLSVWSWKASLSPSYESEVVRNHFFHNWQRINECFLTFPTPDHIETWGNILHSESSAATGFWYLSDNVLNVKSLNFLHSFYDGVKDLHQFFAGQVFLQIFMESFNFLPPHGSVCNTIHTRAHWSDKTTN